ncbi:ABC transporter substrate-binding protein [Pseudorhizobium endolithicum]|uniref:ABC transporter substrate-binding protein n=1 Tax=Pseudorhizobium endolithicum TaxID=1191678 RepID=A0ABM8PRT8_9HYPH|nr:branched-chain amino acid ABC transporter substrate-binding protein [Pseudorhizobium endolithicum]CAD7045026.1 ABC transporter substrate-binding protein [Pseudorhizobium endolithicum]
MPVRLIAVTAALSLLAAPIAMAATIAVVAPQAGPYATLGQQVLAGARAAASTMGHTVLPLDENCESDAAAVADRIIEGKAVAAIGFLCSETLAGVMPRLSQAAIPALTIAVRSRILMEDARREGWPLYRMAPSEGDEAEKIAEVVLERWKADPVAIIDDGTIYGRELASAVRQSVEAGGISPVFVDTYRPGQEQQVALVRRLQKAGATHVVIGGDRNDIAVIARDAEKENIPLQLLAGDTMRAADQPVPLRDGVLAVAVPDYAARPTAGDAVAAIRSAGVEPEGYALPAYAAVQLVDRALSEAVDTPPPERIRRLHADTVVGPIAFDDLNDLFENPLRLQEWRSGRFVVVDIRTE